MIVDPFNSANNWVESDVISIDCNIAINLVRDYFTVWDFAVISATNIAIENRGICRPAIYEVAGADFMTNIISIDCFTISASFSCQNITLWVKEDNRVNLIGETSMKFDGFVGRSAIWDFNHLI